MFICSAKRAWTDFTLGRLLIGLSLPVALALTACAVPKPGLTPVTPAAPAKPVLEVVAFNNLPGWTEDHLQAAWPAFIQSCKGLRAKPEWRTVCADASALTPADSSAVRAFFETRFNAHRLRDSNGAEAGLITGYYEPLLRGSRVAQAPYLTPLYGIPNDLLTIELGSIYPELATMRLRGRLQGNKVLPYPSRADIVSKGLPGGKELVWVDNPLDAFFLQIQGSGRVVLSASNGVTETIRLGYQDQNGHPYKSIGRWLVDRGELSLEETSMQGITAWAARHPERLDEMLNANPSYVFFREAKITDPSVGPNGALGVPLTPERSIAVDPTAIPLGAPVFIDTTRPDSNAPIQRLTMAQDRGGAIRGVIRADYFWGFGAEAGELAGRMKQQGRLWVLLPK